MDLLERLSKKYKIALLSDTSEWDFEYGIKKTRVFPLFSEVTVSFEVGVLKPNKAMYEDILKKLNLQPEECVFIDDKKPYSDMATKLGIHGINYVSHKELLISLQKIGVEL